eukprot:TRINITY_DN11487_c0_g1_i2.p1 TRINITY_DN11487_c0_g1~~TRINITY_DN11487_c0_g1_i2.p1  ORF type:complete len:619 (+),score=107.82 TRINITY_DN11487_c0_g1_i2:33-1889(+)
MDEPPPSYDVAVSASQGSKQPSEPIAPLPSAPPVAAAAPVEAEAATSSAAAVAIATNASTFQSSQSIEASSAATPQWNGVSSEYKQYYRNNGQANVRVMAKSSWVPSSSRQDCTLCGALFGWFTRWKHHCRVCGCLVCDPCSKQRHPLFAEQRICYRCYSTTMAKASGLQDCEWYHGKVSRTRAARTLSSAASLPGDFLVRESSRDGFLAISALSMDGRLTHSLIAGSAGRWYMRSDEVFPTVQALIESAAAKGRLLRAAAVLEADAATNCPSCPRKNIGIEHLFCPDCGTRLRSSAHYQQQYEGQGTGGGQGAEQEEESDYQTLEEVKQAANELYRAPPANPGYQAFVDARFTTDPRVELLRNHLRDEGHVRMGRKIGQGRAGDVYMAAWGGQTIVMKKPQSKMHGDGVIHEALALSALKHPHVVTMLGVSFGKHPALWLEHCAEGDLSSYLTKSQKKLTVGNILGFLGQIADGLAYLHSRTMAHGDIAARNILLDANLQCRIADFDLARWEGSILQDCAKTMATRWCSPEMLASKAPSKESDVWALAVVGWECFSAGRLPYNGLDLPAVRQKVTSYQLLDKPSTCPSPVWNVLMTCFVPEASRPDAASIRDQLLRL